MGKGRSRIRWLDNARDKIRVADAAVEFCGGVDTREASASGQLPRRINPVSLISGHRTAVRHSHSSLAIHRDGGRRSAPRFYLARTIGGIAESGASWRRGAVATCVPIAHSGCMLVQRDFGTKKGGEKNIACRTDLSKHCFFRRVEIDPPALKVLKPVDKDFSSTSFVVFRRTAPDRRIGSSSACGKAYPTVTDSSRRSIGVLRKRSFPALHVNSADSASPL